MQTLALTRNRISVYSGDEHGRLFFVTDWPLNKALAMVAAGIATIASNKAVHLVKDARLDADERCKLRHPHAVKPKRAGSSHGDAGRSPHGFRSFYMAVSTIEAGL